MKLGGNRALPLLTFFAPFSCSSISKGREATGYRCSSFAAWVFFFFGVLPFPPTRIPSSLLTFCFSSSLRARSYRNATQ